MKFSLLIIFFVGNFIHVFAQSKNESVQKLLDKAVDKKNIPGIAAIVVYQDSTGKIQQEFYTAGYAIKESKYKFTEGTIVEIGSITKVITAYVLVDILQQKKIDIDSEIKKWIPDSVRKNKAVANITFKQLLNHTSGLERIPSNLPDTETPYDKYTAQDLMRYLKITKTNPIGKYDYSNTGMGLAGWLAIKISKATDYYELVKKTYAAKFGMYNYTDENKQFAMAQGYLDTVTKAPIWSFDVLIGCGGLKYNSQRMAEMIKTCLFTQNDTIAKKLEYLYANTYSIDKTTSIGLGWHNLNLGKNNIVWHNGGTYGFSTFLGINNKSKVGVFIVANQFNLNETVDGIGITLLNKFENFSKNK